MVSVESPWGGETPNVLPSRSRRARAAETIAVKPSASNQNELHAPGLSLIQVWILPNMASHSG